MTICEPVKFGISTVVPLSTITSTPSPVTDLEWIKDEWRANTVKYINPNETIVMEGILESAEIGEYFALPGSNLVGLSQIKLELFTAVDSEVDVLNMPLTQLAHLTPLGRWRAGIDKFGVPRESDTPAVFVYWFPKALAFIKWRLTIVHTGDALAIAVDVRLRMLMLGRKLQLSESFDYGSVLSQMTAPQLLITASGSNVPSGRQVKSRKLQITLSNMSENDFMALAVMEENLAGSPFIFSAFPGSSIQRFNKYSFLARFATALDYEHAQGDVFSSTLTIIEV